MSALSRGARVARYGLSGIAGSLPAMAVQVGALLTLTPAQFGMFAALYLVYAWFLSLSLSFLNEPWTRDGRREDEAAMLCMAVWVSTGAAAVGGAVALTVLGSVPGALVASGALALAVLRQNSRYVSVSLGEHRRNTVADVVAVAPLVVGFLIPGAGVVGALTAWTASSLLALALSLRTVPHGAWNPLSWWRNHRSSIATLLADSFLTDLGSIGVPALLGPAMGPVRFGVYRALGSVALPVRMLASSIRPIIGRWPAARLLAPGTLAAVVALAALVASGVTGTVVLLAKASVLSSTVLGPLSGFWPALLVFLLAYTLLSYLHMVTRVVLGARRLLPMRAVILVWAVVGPLTGWNLAGLTGAVWGFTGSIILQALTALSFSLRHTRGTREASTSS